jgi:tol-pal system protein YbgF
VKKRFFLLPLILLVLGGCAGVMRMPDELEEVKKSNRRLEMENQDLKERVAIVDSLMRVQIEQSREIRADFNSSMGWMDDRLRVVESKLDDSGLKVHELTQKVGMMQPQEKPLDTLAISDTTQPQVKVDPQSLYDAAYLNVVKGNYELAILGFKDFLSYFGTTPLAPDAQYYVAECYYMQKDYQKAASEFEKLIQNYQPSGHFPPSLFKLGLIYMELNDTTRANECLSQLVNNYPESNEAKLAKDRLGVGR